MTQKPTVEFKDCKNYGDMIKALTREFIGKEIGTFVLEKAIEEVNNNNKKLKAFKEELLNKEVEKKWKQK